MFLSLDCCWTYSRTHQYSRMARGAVTHYVMTNKNVSLEQATKKNTPTCGEVGVRKVCF